MATVVMTRAEAVRVMRAGTEAAKANRLPTACPYKGTGSGLERMKRAAWMRGYATV